MATCAEQMAWMNGKTLEPFYFKNSIWFNGVEIPCIAPPLDVFQQITRGPYDSSVTLSFQILETDRATSGMQLMSVIGFDSPYAAMFKEGATRLDFEVKNFKPDTANDSMVQVICSLKQ